MARDALMTRGNRTFVGRSGESIRNRKREFGSFQPGNPQFSSTIETTPNSVTGTDYYRYVLKDPNYGNIIVYYYVSAAANPTTARRFAPLFNQLEFIDLTRKRRLMVGIHGAGSQHYQGAMTHLGNMTSNSFADNNNLIVIAPAFERWYFPEYGGIPDPYPDGYLTGVVLPNRHWDPRPDWVVDGSQEDCAFLYDFWENGFWPDPPDVFPIQWDYNLYRFTYAFPWYGQYRTDLMLNLILDQFNEAFNQASDPVEEKILLYGHSGGAQFTSRYFLLWPERLYKVAFSSAGSMLFPTFEHRFPLGLNVYLEGDAVVDDANHHYQVTTPGGLDDLIALRDNNLLWYNRFRDICKVPVIYSVGSLEGTDENYNDRSWQGGDTLQTSNNYVLEMKKIFSYARRFFGDEWPSDAVHDLLFMQFDTDHGGNLTATWNWLKEFWLDYPTKVPYWLLEDGQKKWRYP